MISKRCRVVLSVLIGLCYLMLTGLTLGQTDTDQHSPQSGLTAYSVTDDGPLAGVIVCILALVCGALNIWIFRLRKSAGETRRRLALAEEKLTSALDELKTEEQQWRSVVTRDLATWDWDIASQRYQLSDAFLEITGYTMADIEAMDHKIVRAIHPDDRDLVDTAVDDFLAGRTKAYEVQFRIRNKSGGYKWFLSRANGVWDSDGKPTHLIGFLSDIDKTAAAKQERDRLVKLSADMMCVSGFDGRLRQFNPAWKRILGWSAEELLTKPIIFFIHPRDHSVALAAERSLQAGEEIRGLETRLRCRDGSYRWLSWNCIPLLTEEQVFSVLRDVTAQKQAQRRLLKHQEQLRALASQLSLVEERQRRELAVALHDGLGQNLFAARAMITILEHPEAAKDHQRTLNELSELLDTCMGQARSLSFELCPPILYEDGLAPALDWLTQHFTNQTGIECTFQNDAKTFELNGDKRSIVYQCVRELLSNINKHAQAERAELTMTGSAEYLTLMVEDDGIGISEVERNNVSFADQIGFGLFSVRERLRPIGGRLIIESGGQKGTQIILTVPVSGSSNANDDLQIGNA